MLVKQKWSAENDENGNPRRLWLIMKVGEGRNDVNIVSVVDEGYGNLSREDRTLPELPHVRTGADTYDSWIAHAEERGILTHGI